MLFSTLVLGLTGTANAAGYYLAKAEALYGTSELDNIEAGFGLSLMSDALEYWMTFGDPAEPGNATGHVVREWWLQGGYWGVQLSDAPNFLDLDEALERHSLPTYLARHRYWRLGADHTTRKNMEWDSSDHLVLSLPGFFGVEPSRVHFGPTLGVGWNLTWWDRWKDVADYTVNTGKITAEGGWVAGFTVRDAFYAQGRLTGHYDLFGIHQVNARAAAIIGVYLGRLGVPVGVEVKGEADRGNDTVTTGHAETWALRAALVVKGRPPDDERQEIEELRKLLLELDEEQPSGGQTTL